MTNQEQQKNQQPQVSKETEYAFAPPPRTMQEPENAKTTSEISETTPAPEEDIDNVN